MSVYTHIQTGDWKAEKHVPAIESPDKVAAGEVFDVKVSLGKAAAHPNTTEHHIRYIRLFFKPDDDKFVYNVGNCDFAAHGESAAGANEGPVHCHHGTVFQMSARASGTLHAVSYCNIHGLWESKKHIDVE
jgi:superoxide reductase